MPAFTEQGIAAILTALFGGIGVVIGAWFTGRKLRAEAHKSDAEADSTAVAAANAFIATLQNEVMQLKARVEGLENDVRKERLLSNEINIKYHNALDRIVELEKETLVLRRQLAEARQDIEKHRLKLDGALNPPNTNASN